MNNKSIIWRNEALAAIATSYNPSAERARDVLMDAQLAVMGLPEAALNVWKWHPYPEERPVKGENKEYRGNYLIWTEGGFCSPIEYHYGKGKWNVTDSCEDNEFKDVIAWAEIVPYRRQSDGSD